MATNKQVADAFVKGAEAHSDNMHSTGSRLYSYALQIAHWSEDKLGADSKYIKLDYDERRGHTVTTQRHMRELERAIRQRS